GGLTFDWTGSYATAWGSLLAVGTAAFLVQWAMDDRTPAERARAAAGAA
ncbi:MAG: MFS transporter, partial [Alphaproteobacteria bacterium]|nr:MFS transporter [Alphaproteobacteria bacterium]